VLVPLPKTEGQADEVAGAAEGAEAFLV